MRTVWQALTGAVWTTLSCWRLVLLLWLVTATLAVVLASPLFGAIDSAYAHNPLSGGLLGKFDGESYIDFHNVHANEVRATSEGVRAAALPWLLLWSLLSAGVISRVVGGKDRPGFLAACGRYGHRFLWLLLPTGLALLGLWWLNDRLTPAVTRWLVDDYGRGSAVLGWGMTAKTTVMALLAGAVLHAGRLARLRVVKLGERFVIGSWVRALGALLRRPHTLGVGLGLATLPTVAVIAAWAAATEGLFTDRSFGIADAGWRTFCVAQCAQLLFQAALLYRVAVEVRLWPLIGPGPARPVPAPKAPANPRPAPSPAQPAPARPPSSSPGPAVPAKPTPDSSALRVTVLLVAALSLPAATARGQQDAPATALPRSEHRGAYVMDVVLDTGARTASASESATFLNTTSAPVRELWMHLYAAAFAHTQSTWMRAGGPDPVLDRGPEDGGYIDVRRVRLAGGRDLSASVEIDDTLMRVPLPSPVPPGGSVTLAIDFVTRFPRVVARMGTTGPHIDGMQWYPKYCVHTQDGWVLHQFDRVGEFFADFATYDVTFHSPVSLVLEATGVPGGIHLESAGMQRVRYRASDVHDFAFCADPNFVRVPVETFVHTGPPRSEVDIVYLCQPYALPKAQQVVDVVRSCLKFAADHWMPYPYERVVIDGLPHGLGGGMEYPMLFTISQRFPNHLDWLVNRTEDPAGVTAHEFGHQYWYGIMASNEFDEAWLDEGINTWGTVKFLEAHFPDRGRTDALTFVERHLVAGVFNGSFTGRVPGTGITFGLQHLVGWRTSPFHDVPPEEPRSSPTLLGWYVPGPRSLRLPDMSAGRMASNKGRYYWDARVAPLTAPSPEFTRGYGSLVYSKSALVLQTLENLIGFDAMQQLIRAYVGRFRFRHPTTEDFLAVVSEVTSGEHDRLLRQLVTTAGAIDFTVEQVSTRRDRRAGFAPQTRPGDPLTWTADEEPDNETPDDEGGTAEGESPVWISRYVVRQLGEVVAPVDVEARFEDGSAIRGRWDGAGGYHRFEHTGSSELVEVVVDPDRIYAIDLNVNNNGYRLEAVRQTPRALKALDVFWTQNFLNGWSFLF